MDFKYAKNSLTLEQLSENIKKEKMEQVCAKHSKKNVFSDEYFKTAEEMIDWVMSGNPIVNPCDDSEWMQLIDGKIIHQSFELTDIGLPIGYLKHSLSIEEFKDWVLACEEISERNDIPVVNEYFIKG
jgi:hypothetical protein